MPNAKVEFTEAEKFQILLCATRENLDILMRKVNESHEARDLKKFQIYTEAIGLARTYPANHLTSMLEAQRHMLEDMSKSAQLNAGAAQDPPRIPLPSEAPSRDELDSASAIRLMDPIVATNQRVSANNGRGEPYRYTARPDDSYLNASTSHSGGSGISSIGLAQIAGMRIIAPSSVHYSATPSSSSRSVSENPQLAGGTQQKRR
ncbi:hypothetical protein ACWD3J_45175 [Streptomyces sp. NPDC002755]|uniref:hypothetical protein n=1 Tax=Streptomyces sp. NPDC002884 TaxID=3154544 RepID=UPI00332392AB